MVDRFERFSFAINEITRCWHRIAGDEMGKYGLKGPYSVYFTTLFRHPKGLTSVQLTELCGRDKAEVSRTISLLESKGLVIREAVGSSAYRALLRLTQEGFALAEVINQKAAMAVEMVSQGLPPEKRAVFYETLELITNNLQTLSKQGIPDTEVKEKHTHD